eukprot:6490264-Amphidinium_carterae.4
MMHRWDADADVFRTDVTAQPPRKQRRKRRETFKYRHEHASSPWLLEHSKFFTVGRMLPDQKDFAPLTEDASHQWMKEASWIFCPDADVLSKQKKTVIRGVWKAKPLETIGRSPAAQRAFRWLMDNNTTLREVCQATQILVREAPR